MNKLVLVIYFLILITAINSCKKSKNQLLSYSNLEELDYKPEMVAPGVVSQASFEGHASINPEGDKLYFAVYTNDHLYSVIAYSSLENDRWTYPEIVSFSGKYRDGSPTLSPDGNRLYFSSNRPVVGDSSKLDDDIWYVEKTSANKWSAPIRLNDQINSDYSEFSPSVDNNGNLFFCSNRPGGLGNMDVYFAEIKNGMYQTVEILSDSINSIYHEGNVGVSPNGKQLFIMIQNKPGGFGYDDIYFSELKSNGWSKAKNVGNIINTATYDFSPKVSPNGKVLYFSSRINRDYTNITTSYSFDTFKDYLNSPLNGFGNIFKIPIDSLQINK